MFQFPTTQSARNALTQPTANNPLGDFFDFALDSADRIGDIYEKFNPTETLIPPTSAPDNTPQVLQAGLPTWAVVVGGIAAVAVLGLAAKEVLD